jgi:hypothetical protein
MANKIVVRVFANDADGDIVFTHDWSANGGPPRDGAIDLPRNSGAWDFDIHFFDATGLGLQLEQNADDAIWVRQGKGCPKGKGNGGHLTFGGTTKPKKPGGPLNLLQLSDDNSGAACELHFMLRLDSPRGKYRYDPVINNGGRI